MWYTGCCGQMDLRIYKQMRSARKLETLTCTFCFLPIKIWFQNTQERRAVKKHKAALRKKNKTEKTFSLKARLKMSFNSQSGGRSGHHSWRWQRQLRFFFCQWGYSCTYRSFSNQHSGFPVLFSTLSSDYWLPQYLLWGNQTTTRAKLPQSKELLTTLAFWLPSVAFSLKKNPGKISGVFFSIFPKKISVEIFKIL